MFKNLSILVMALIVFTGCKNKTSEQQTISTQKIAFTKDGELTFYNSKDKKIKHLDIEVAKSAYEQETGLMYRKNMKEDRGMLFVYGDERPRPNFYMKNTYIGLDMIYIGAHKKVVDIYQNAKPLDETSIPSSAPAQYVLEINAGMAKKWGLEVGDKVNFQLN